MKGLKNLNGVTVIHKSAQKSINGGHNIPDAPDCYYINGCIIEINLITGLCFCEED